MNAPCRVRVLNLLTVLVAIAPAYATTPIAQPVTPALLPDFKLEGGAEVRRETVDRPAFVPTRRPAPAPPQQAPAPRMQKGQFVLTGTAVVDKKAIAFLRENAGGKARSVRAGETINGLTVTEIRADRIRLTLGDEAEELVLKVAAGPRQTIQPPQPAIAQVLGAPPVPGTPAGAAIAGQSAPQDSDAQILERRRAARAQLAAEAAARAAPSGEASPRPVGPLAAPQPTPAPATGAPPAPASAPDPAWAGVYRRMQQPRR